MTTENIYLNIDLLEYKGEHSSAPLSPQKGWFYKNTDNGVMYYFDGTNWIAYAEGGGGGGIIFIERSLPDLHIDISNNELVPGATYKITGVHRAHMIDDFPLPIGALYDDGRDLGTTIFLKAISENELETFGSGIFYNPKYDKQVQGFGIWSNRVDVSLSNISGSFNHTSKEGVTADNGAKGIILTNGWIQYVSGDWSSASSITGDSSGATADIDSVTVPNYSVDDIVFWGGYAWKNLNGNTGSDTDILNLDGEWEKLNYDDVNYNKVVDYIEYDIENDIITRRYDTVNDIDVSSGFLDIVFMSLEVGVDFSSVSLMQWGNDIDFSSGIAGVWKISVKHLSFIELINFKGVNASNVTLDNQSRLQNVTFDNQSSLQNVTLDNGSILSNVTFDNGTGLKNVTFDNGSFLQNVAFDNGLYLRNTATMGNSANLQNVTFVNGSGLDRVTFVNRARLENVTFDNSTMIDNTFVSFVANFSAQTYSNLILSNIKFEGSGGATYTIPDISNATIITDPNIPQKKVFGIDATTQKIQYWDSVNSNFVVADITD